MDYVKMLELENRILREQLAEERRNVIKLLKVCQELERRNVKPDGGVVNEWPKPKVRSAWMDRANNSDCA